MAEIDRPKKNVYRATFYSVDEMLTLLDVFEEDPLDLPVKVAAYYGLRRSKEKEKQEMYRHLFKKSYCKDYLDYICVDQTGKILRPNYVTEHFAWVIEKYGLKKIRFHDLRHTCASLLLSKGISIKQIQIWLGHRTYSTTADIYAHLDTTAQEESATAMSGMFTKSAQAVPVTA